MWKILLLLIGIWLIFKIFGRYIFLYLVKKIIKRLEDQTLESMRYHQNMYNDEQNQSFHHKSGFKIITPNKEHKSTKIFRKNIEEVICEEVNTGHEAK